VEVEECYRVMLAETADPTGDLNRQKTGHKLSRPPSTVGSGRRAGTHPSSVRAR
jgi:hypothetical protein